MVGARAGPIGAGAGAVMGGLTAYVAGYAFDRTGQKTGTSGTREPVGIEIRSPESAEEE